MPNYLPLSVNGSQLGLNDRVKPDALRPGEAVTADNVEFRDHTVSKRRGYRPILTGNKDSVIRGGPVGANLYVQGEPYWMEHFERERNRPGGPNSLAAPSGDVQNRHGWHRREGVIIVPEGNQSDLVMNPQTTSPNWILELCLWSDDLTVRQTLDDNTAAAQPAHVMCKGPGTGTTTSHWSVRLISEGNPSSGQTRVYVALTFTENNTGFPLHNFFYDSAGGSSNPASFFEPGKRHWVAWEFNEVSNEITSYYWQEGDSAAVSSTQAVPANLLTNGVDTTADPSLTIGRAAGLEVTDTTTSRRYNHAGFNGVVSELRFYSSANGVALTHPTYDSSYPYYEAEVPDSELTGGGTWGGDNDVTLYYSFAEEYVSNTNRVAPRINSASDNASDAWIHGADGTWVELGSTPFDDTRGMEIFPAVDATANGNIRTQYFEGIGNVEQSFGAGIRIPRGDLYFPDDEDASNNIRRLPQALTIRWVGRLDALPTSGLGGTTRSLATFWRVRNGTVSTRREEYGCLDAFGLRVKFGNPGGGANHWYIEGYYSVQGGAADPEVVFSPLSHVLSEGSLINVTMTVLQRGARLDMRLYSTTNTSTGALDEIATRTVAAGISAAFPSTNTNTTTSSLANRTEADNYNDKDGRNQLFPAYIGCDVTTTQDDEVPNTQTFMCGANVETGADEDNDVSTTDLSRLYWSFHTNSVKFTPNSGVGYRGRGGLIGVVASLQVWHRFLTEAEVQAFAVRAPNEQETARYGDELLSNWDFEEGKGNLIFDKGALGNHIPVNPYPQVRKIADGLSREQKSQILNFWEVRTRTPREGTTGRDIYALAGGSLCRAKKDSSGNFYLEAISGRHHHQEKLLGTAFQFSDFFYVCTGEGPPLRNSRGRVVEAGVSPVFGQPQGDHLGWAEEDRDGTFLVHQNDTQASGNNFVIGSKYSWLVTFYDPESGVESAPSRIVPWVIEGVDFSSAHPCSASGSTAAYESVTLKGLPKSRQRHVTRMRIYRTAANGATFFFVDEIDAAYDYLDDTADTDLGRSFDASDNFPPPLNARLGVVAGDRAIYAGIPEFPSTLYYSKIGFPEIVPPIYQLTVGSVRSSEITGLLPFQDRTMVFLQDSTFVLFDSGQDISTLSNIQPPMQISLLREDIGCVNHHTIAQVDNVGAVFAGERGIYVTDGNSFNYVSDRIENTYGALDKSTYRQWHAVHLRRNDQYLLFCSSGAESDDRNDRVIVWDYGRNVFSVIKGIQARSSAVIEDETTGANRVYWSDYYGGLHEYNPPDVDVHRDGVPSGTDVAGTVGSGATTTVVPLGTTLPTDGDGLRGVVLTVGDVATGASSEERRILSNTSSAVTLESALGSAPSSGTVWYLGRISSDWRTGKMDMGSEIRLKRATFVEVNFAPSTGAYLNAHFGYDELATDDFTLAASTSLVPSGQRDRFANFVGRGRRIQLEFKDEKPDNHWEVTELEMAWYPKGRSKYPI